MTAEYTARCVGAARGNREFVLGFVSQRSLNGVSAAVGADEGGDEDKKVAAVVNDNFLCLAPGVGMPPAADEEEEAASASVSETTRQKGGGGDGMGQRWRDPREVVGRDGIDVVIVGRGVLGAEDRGKEAERYRRRAWEAYEARIGRRGWVRGG